MLGQRLWTQIWGIDYDDFQQRMYGNAPNQLAQIITHIGLAQEAGFPLTQLCLELVLECEKHYDFRTRIIIGPQGRVMQNITEESIAKVFDISSHHKLIE